VALLAESTVPFSEVSAHRASLEEAYMELTRDTVEFRAADSAGSELDSAGSAGPASASQAEDAAR
jgi:ABC-2 type transport system ATP-binding protein